MRQIQVRWWLALVLVVFGVVLLFAAFQCDDAFITFRTVQNVWQGRGLTWNPGERVQAYTHPAWMMLALACYGISGECYFSVLALAFLVSIGAAFLLSQAREGEATWACARVVLLGSSLAIVHYAVCGLENPLLFLLLAGFVWLLRNAGSERLGLLSLLVALVVLTRQDAVLLVGPAFLLRALPQMRRARALLPIALGFSPILVWELFSLVYYGALVPNTALAKLNVAVPQLALTRQALHYFGDSLTTDPITLLTTLACSAVLLRRGALDRALVLGIGLHFVYLLRIGGDFMSGRFFGAPLVLALASVATAPDLRPSIRLQRALLAATVVYALLWPRSPYHLNYEYGVGLGFAEIVADTGIADERAYYYPTTGLLRVLIGFDTIEREQLPVPPYRQSLRGRAFAVSDHPLAVEQEIGFFGYFAGAKPIVDLWALSDPLLARIPFKADGRFRVGHYEREPPDGYLESRIKGENLIRDPEIARLYDNVQRVVSGPLFAPERWRAIARLNGFGF